MAPHPAPFSSLALVAYVLFAFIPLVVKPSRYRWLYFLPILALSFHTLYTTTGNATNDYALASGWFALFFSASDFILITDVQNELRSVKPPQAKPISQEGLWNRFKWALDLFTSPRGVGWAHEPVSVLPSRPVGGKSRFILQQLARVTVVFLLFDLTLWHNSYNPAFSRDGPSLTSYGWFWRYESIWGWAVAAYTGMALPNCFISILSVGLGWSDPEDWPWFFGSFLDAWSVRRFWGRTWHQLLRRLVTAHGRFVSRRVLHLAPGTNASSYVQLYTAFFISGIIHYLADYMILRDWSGNAMKFFMLQAVAISFEDGIISLGRRAGVKGNGLAWRLLGYAWVWSWFALVFPIWQDPLMKAGAMDDGATSLLQKMWDQWRIGELLP